MKIFFILKRQSFWGVTGKTAYQEYSLPLIFSAAFFERVLGNFGEVQAK